MLSFLPPVNNSVTVGITFLLVIISAIILSNYKFLLLIRKILSRFFHLVHLSFILFYILLLVTACLSHNLKYQIQFQHLLYYLCKYHLFLCIQRNYLYLYKHTALFISISIFFISITNKLSVKNFAV